MPIREYRCDKCGHQFELLEGISSDQEGKVCPQCGSRKIKPLLSSFATSNSQSGGGSDCSSGNCPLSSQSGPCCSSGNCPL